MPSEPVCLGRRRRPSVKRGQLVQPGMPSFGEIPAPKRESASIPRAVTWVFRVGPTLGVPSPPAPRVPLSRRPRLLRARSPSPPAGFAIFTQSTDTRFSGSDNRPPISATSLRRTDTLKSVRISCPLEPPFRRWRACVPFSRLFWRCDLPLSKKDRGRHEPWQPFRCPPRDVAKSSRGRTPKAVPPSRRRLRATPRPDYRLRR